MKIDIMDVKSAIKSGDLECCEFNNSILLKDTKSGEAVKIYDIIRDKYLDRCLDRHHPTEFQLKKINAINNSCFTAKDVYVFVIRICDDQVDVDNERFDTSALPTLANMFIGKKGFTRTEDLFMDTSVTIFDTEVVLKDGVSYIKAYAFILKNILNADFIHYVSSNDDVSVSIGCSMARSTCSICGNSYVTYKTCDHVKGRDYNRRRCVNILSEPQEVYEFTFPNYEVK